MKMLILTSVMLACRSRVSVLCCIGFSLLCFLSSADRASRFEREGREFESLRERQVWSLMDRQALSEAVAHARLLPGCQEVKFLGGSPV